MAFTDYLLAELRHVAKLYATPDILQKEAFIRNLVFCYHFMRASEPLLELAVSKSEGKLKKYYEEHLEEERKHEQWVADDLASLGVDVNAWPISKLAVQMAGSQYYLISFVDPVMLLGYMARLECFPMSMEQLEQLEAAHGKEALRCVRYHAQNDVDHGKDLLNIIDELPEEKQLMVLENALHTAHYIGAAQQGFGK